MLKRISLALAVALVFSGCQKILDYYDHHHGQKPPGCRITELSSSTESFIDTTRIGYNGKGQPVSIEYITYDLGFNGYHAHTFVYTYDHSDRLVSETSDWVYSQELIYYAYEGDSKRPARDTLPRIFGQVVVEDFDYDSDGRIIKIVKRTISQWDNDPTEYPTEEYRYFYDMNGNRQEDPSNPGYPGLIEYSNKPSLYSLNPVWQVVHKNYSRNSTLNVETYNDKGLPLTIKNEQSSYFQSFLNLQPGSHIAYECD